jgi:putative ABC transport system permease protein
MIRLVPIHSTWRPLLRGVRALFSGGDADSDVADEVRHYVDEAAAAYEAQGCSPERARRAALADIGSVTAVREQVRSSGWENAIGSAVADLRYALRRLRAAPGFTVVAIVVLGLGIGANTASVTLIEALFFEALPLPGAERLVHIYAHRPGRSFEAGFSGDEYASLRARMRTVSSLAAQSSVAQLHVQTDGEIRELRGDFVSANYFQTLNVEAARGRFFLPQEDAESGRYPVAAISDRFWRESFAAADRAVGSVIHVNGLAVTIVGVAPPGFQGDDVSRGAELWLPQAMVGPAGYGCPAGTACNSLDMFVGRLQPGADLRAARADAAATILWSPGLDEESGLHRGVVVESAAGADPDTRAMVLPQMQLLAAITGVLLLVACANLAGLLLGRGLTRTREIAVRLSIGATRGRIIRQLLTEGLLLSATGGLAGFFVSTWAVARLASFYNVDSEGFRHSYSFQPDAHVFLYICVIAVVAGMVTAIVPALQSSRQDLSVALKDARGGAGGPRGRRLRQALVVAQVALSAVLIVCSSLVARSTRTVMHGTHFDPSSVVVLRIRPELVPYPASRAETFAREAAGRLRATPGVESVGMMIGGEGLVWMSGGHSLSIRIPDGRAGTGSLTITGQDVDPAFFETLRMPMLAGRAFDDGDRAQTERVAIVNEALARRVWPADIAVGRTLLVGDRPYQVVGVAADIEPPNIATGPVPHLYLPFWQTPPAAKGDVRFAIRVAGSPAAALPALRAAIRALDPAVPLGEDMPMTTQVALQYSTVLLADSVTSACGLLALLLSAIGLYTVLSLAIRSRTREIGIRIAIGARPRDIARQFLRDALTLAMSGIAIGLAAAWVAMRLIVSLLYGVSAHDFGAFGAAAALVLVTAIAAGYLPARRAARVDPILALRAE